MVLGPAWRRKLSAGALRLIDGNAAKNGQSLRKLQEIWIGEFNETAETCRIPYSPVVCYAGVWDFLDGRNSFRDVKCRQLY
jgi:hypothetical protein